MWQYEYLAVLLSPFHTDIFENEGTTFRYETTRSNLKRMNLSSKIWHKYWDREKKKTFRQRARKSILFFFGGLPSMVLVHYVHSSLL